MKWERKKDLYEWNGMQWKVYDIKRSPRPNNGMGLLCSGYVSGNVRCEPSPDFATVFILCYFEVYIFYFWSHSIRLASFVMCFKSHPLKRPIETTMILSVRVHIIYVFYSCTLLHKWYVKTCECVPFFSRYPFHLFCFQQNSTKQWT